MNLKNPTSMRFLILILALGLCVTCTQAQQQQQQQQAPPQTQTQQQVKQAQTPPKTVKVKGVTYDLSPVARNKEYPYSVSLKDANRKIIQSSDAFSNGERPVVLIFWMTTCVPCQYELKAIKEKYDEWKEVADFDLYAISMDFEKREEAVYRKIASAGWKWETYYDFKREFTRVMPGGMNGLPQTFVFDKNGEIVYHKKKYRMGQEDVLFNKIVDLQ